MSTKEKRRPISGPAALTVCLLAVLAAGGFLFNGYLQQQIYVERSAQLREVTAQVRVNLDNALEAHWRTLMSAVRLLEERAAAAGQASAPDIGRLEELLGMDRDSSKLVLLDSGGNCYDMEGKHGVWTDLDRLSGGAERYAFISDSFLYPGSCWAFVQALDTPLETGTPGVRFTHAILLKDVHTLSQSYASSAYGSHNETYVLKSDGTRMHDITEENTIQSYNVVKVLEEMEGQGISDIRSALAEEGIVSTSFWYGGKEYYYCLAALEDYDTLLLFLTPAEFVASGTVRMVNTVVYTLVGLGVVVLALSLLAVAAMTRRRNSARLLLQEQANLRRQEELNARLEDSNAMLARSKETAEQAFQIAEEANRAKSSFLSNMSHPEDHRLQPAPAGAHQRHSGYQQD